MGLLVGALAREVPTASLLAFALLLPVAFLALVPSGVVSAALYDVTRVISALFPFRPTLDAIELGALRRGCAAVRRCCTWPPWPRHYGRAARVALEPFRLRRRRRATVVYTWSMAFPATRLRRMRTDERAARLWCARPSCRSSHLDLSAVRHSRQRPPRADRVDAGNRAADDLAPGGARRGEIAALGIPAVLLFGIPADKDEAASGAYDPEGIVQLAVRAHQAGGASLTVITDVCLCEYTSHGHCGVVREDGAGRQRPDARAARQDGALARRGRAPTRSRRPT